MSYLQSLGSMAIASRLKSLSDLLARDMNLVYKKQNIEFEPRWFTFFHLIYHKGSLSITQIAREIKQSHPAANQVANALEKKGLIKSIRDEKDNRKRIIALTSRGKSLAKKLKPIWQAVELATELLLEESGTALLDSIEAIEKQVSEKPAAERILAALHDIQGERIQIEAYREAYKPIFKTLNIAWLNEFFEVEPEDLKLLDNPQEQIINKGGLIFFARLKDKIIGTAALMKLDQETCELTKMAVAREHQGIQAGRLLLQNVIQAAVSAGYKKMILLTGEKLHKAVSLYKSEGFILSDQASVLEHNLKRCSIQMELNLINIHNN